MYYFIILLCTLLYQSDWVKMGKWPLCFGSSCTKHFHGNRGQRLLWRGASEWAGVVFNEGGGCSSSLLIQYEGLGHINCMVTWRLTQRAPPITLPPGAYSQEHESSCARGSPPPPRGDLSSPSVLSHFQLTPAFSSSCPFLSSRPNLQINF